MTLYNDPDARMAAAVLCSIPYDVPPVLFSHPSSSILFACIREKTKWVATSVFQQITPSSLVISSYYSGPQSSRKVS